MISISFLSIKNNADGKPDSIADLTKLFVRFLGGKKWTEYYLIVFFWILAR